MLSRQCKEWGLNAIALKFAFQDSSAASWPRRYSTRNYRQSTLSVGILQSQQSVNNLGTEANTKCCVQRMNHEQITLLRPDEVALKLMQHHFGKSYRFPMKTSRQLKAKSAGASDTETEKALRFNFFQHPSSQGLKKPETKKTEQLG